MSNTTLSERIRKILDQHGVPRRQHTTTIAKILGLHYVSVHQKFGGSKSWTEEQLVQISKHFSTPIETVVPSHPSGNWNAILMISEVPQRCLIEVDQHPIDAEGENLVAVREHGTWLVTSGASRSSRTTAHRVLSLEIMPAPRVAALDDDAGIPRAIAAEFSTKGIQVFQYTRADDLLAAAHAEPFEAYVVDWILQRKQTAESVVEAIRTTLSRKAPIIVLTGQLATEVVTESHLARIVERYDVSVLEKPALLTILATSLYKKLFFPESDNL
ncbi:hypothetical protein R69746_08057 [Paraburkholderia aspalathi]|uniref:helix-turn-helix domain-containing protein n=1 Tax=Paraburkholderia aspalathi TaxID=1324617 RepID=UPI00190BDBA2|nr:helix-turn-helix domain-containing protein [Paraburkholderia aspalathi]MBK3844016.1 hypothetical protein [Paraburkholderia aspalathi]CAE6865334.1 hypothetical protein R69746_08057 [Paraburkholderia aspalathi]CAE6867252.1 hypothetical protein R75465_08044 [Paraburkholderia aspalathi]